MATIHISEADAARDFAALLAQVRGGDEVIIDSGAGPVVIHAANPRPRSFREMLASMPNDSPAVDDDFAHDVAEARARFNEPLNAPGWD